MRFCGQCGAVLDESAFAAGICPACGSPLDAQDASPAPDRLTDDTLVLAENAPGAGRLTEPAMLLPPVVSPIQSQRGARLPAGRRRWVRPLALAGGLALLALCGLLALDHGLSLLGRSALPPAAAGGTSTTVERGFFQPVASVTTSPRAGTPTTASTTTSGPGATATTTPGASPSPTGAASPTASTTPAAAPALSVSPTNITIAVCLNSGTHFTVGNSGGGTLEWTGSASNSGYILTPSSGTLAGGGQQTVTVKQISASGTVTISAPGAAGSPQVVTVTCDV